MQTVLNTVHTLTAERLASTFVTLKTRSMVTQMLKDSYEYKWNTLSACRSTLRFMFRVLKYMNEAAVWTLYIWGVFAKLWKTTISFVMSALCPSVRPSIYMEQLEPHWMEVREILYLSISLKSDKNTGYFIRKPTYIYGSISYNSS